MASYILSVLGIVLAGVFVDIIVPSGVINKYIRGIYSIFVVAVLISPISKFLEKHKDFKINYKEYEINENLLDYINKTKVLKTEEDIENTLKKEGLLNVDIKLSFSTENNEFKYILCEVNLKNLVISSDKLHINKYQFINEVIKNKTNLTEEEIKINE